MCMCVRCWYLLGHLLSTAQAGGQHDDGAHNGIGVLFGTQQSSGYRCWFYSLTAGDDGDRSLTVICCVDGRSLIASGTR